MSNACISVLQGDIFILLKYVVDLHVNHEKIPSTSNLLSVKKWLGKPIFVLLNPFKVCVSVYFKLLTG